MLAGGAKTMRSETLRCVLIEMNGSGRRFGVADEAIMRRCVTSDSLRRVMTSWRVRSRLLPVDSWNRGGGNTLYVRDIEECRERVRSAAQVQARKSRYLSAVFR